MSYYLREEWGKREEEGGEGEREEEGGERKTDGRTGMWEKHWQAASLTRSDRGWTHNLGMCPDRDHTRNLWVCEDHAPTESPSQGPWYILKTFYYRKFQTHIKVWKIT